MAADESWCEHRLLGANNLLPLLELLGESLHLLLLFPLLSQQLLVLPVRCHQSLFGCAHAEGEKLLAVQEPLHRELGQPEELDQGRVHGALAPLASLAVQAAEGDRANVLLEHVHVQLAHH